MNKLFAFIHKRIKKRKKKKTLHGRSMVEMLGVIAIVGVLSVGGLFGIRLGIEKYRTSITLKDIEMMALATADYYKNDKDATAVNEDDLYAAGFIEKKQHVFGAPIYIRVGARTDGFSIILKEIPQKACSGLLTADWGDSKAINLAAVDVDGSQYGHFEYLPADPALAARACEGKEASDLTFSFYLNRERPD